jgi:DNA-binding NarL/FixJ family response regulator
VAKRILIADDHESVLRGLRALLGAERGWEVCGDAVDGREAVAKAMELRPDLVVLDLAMPRMDGLRAAQEISKRLPAVPIVLHTLYGTTEVERAANQYGIQRVVGKAKPSALISAVEELLSAEATSQPSAPSDETSEIPIPAIAHPKSDVGVTAAVAVQGKTVDEPPGAATPGVVEAQ